MGYKTDDDIPEQLGPGYKLGYLQCKGVESVEHNLNW